MGISSRLTVPRLSRIVRIMPVLSKSNAAPALPLASPRLPLVFHWGARFLLVPAFMLSVGALGMFGLLCLNEPVYSSLEPLPLVGHLRPHPVKATEKPNEPNFQAELPPLKERQAAYWPLVRDLSNQYQLDPALVMAMVHVESKFNPRALSKKGAMGLMQIVPETAEELGLTDPWNPRANLEAGIRYLAKIKKIFNNNLRLALAAYNAGLTKVINLQAVPDHKETRRYLTKVLDKRDYFRDHFLRMAKR